MGLAERFLPELSKLKVAFDIPSRMETSSVDDMPLAIPIARTEFTAIEERILKLLVDGFKPEVIASTLGITPSAISQHLAKEDFRNELARRKTQILSKYKKMDDMYDEVEEDLLVKLKASTMMFTRPGEITAALSKINGMRRRLGVDAQSASTPISQTVNITLPVTIIHKLLTTQEGNVVGIDQKSLVTTPSNTLPRLVHEHLTKTISDQSTR